MADESVKQGGPDKDMTAVYDDKHGRPTLADTERPTNLTEAGNKAPPQDLPCRITTTK